MKSPKFWHKNALAYICLVQDININRKSHPESTYSLIRNFIIFDRQAIFNAVGMIKSITKVDDQIFSFSY